VLVGTSLDLRSPGGFERVAGAAPTRCCCARTSPGRPPSRSREARSQDALRKRSRTATCRSDRYSKRFSPSWFGAEPRRTRSDLKWLDRPPAELRLAGVATAAMALRVDCDLIFRMWRETRGIRRRDHLSVRAFREQHARDLARHYLALLASATEQPQQAVQDIPFWTPPSSNALSGSGIAPPPATPGIWPSSSCSSARWSARRRRGRVFPGTSLTYRELNRRANQVARHLQGQGMRRGTLAGPRFPDPSICWWRCWGCSRRAGHTFRWIPLIPRSAWRS